MSEYFDRFEQAMDAAIERGAGQPWYRRLARRSHRLRRSYRGRPRDLRLVTIGASLGVSVPALAVVGWLVLAGSGPLAAPVATVASSHAGRPVSAVALRVSDQRDALPRQHARVCALTSRSARRASLVDASLPRWLPASDS